MYKRVLTLVVINVWIRELWWKGRRYCLFMTLPSPVSCFGVERVDTYPPDLRQDPVICFLQWRHKQRPCELWLSLAPASHCFHGLVPARESHGAAMNPSEHWLIPRLMEQKEINFVCYKPRRFEVAMQHYHRHSWWRVHYDRTIWAVSIMSAFRFYMLTL